MAIMDAPAAPAGKDTYGLMLGNDDDSHRIVARRLPPRPSATPPSRPLPHKTVIGDYLVPTEPLSGPGLDMPPLTQHLPQGERKRQQKAAAAGKQRFLSKSSCGEADCHCDVASDTVRSNHKLYIVPSHSDIDSAEAHARASAARMDCSGVSAEMDRMMEGGGKSAENGGMHRVANTTYIHTTRNDDSKHSTRNTVAPIADVQNTRIADIYIYIYICRYCTLSDAGFSSRRCDWRER